MKSHCTDSPGYSNILITPSCIAHLKTEASMEQWGIFGRKKEMGLCLTGKIITVPVQCMKFQYSCIYM